MNIVEEMITKGASIRYELGVESLKDEEYRTECLHRAHKILCSIFNPEDDVTFIHRTFHDEKDKPTDKIRLKRFFRTQIKQLRSYTTSHWYEEPDDQMYIRQWAVDVKMKDIRIAYVIECIYNSDFARKPTSDGQIYLYNKRNGILFHMYDDRGCDVCSLDQNVLLPLYHLHRKWILDYDRYDIDQLFNEGLTGITETKEERELRQKLNDQKVADSKMDLTIDNTSNVSHHFEIPTAHATKFAEEVSLTGFTVRQISEENKRTKFEVSKVEMITLIDYQTHLMSMYGKKYGAYTGWSYQQMKR